MVSRDGIGLFLALARKRARTLSAVRVFALAAVAMAALLFSMAWLAARTGPAAYWPVATATVLLVGTLTAAFFGGLRPWRRLKTDTAVARLVGAVHPPLASDLLSAVQLAQTPPAGTSADLLLALRGQVGDAVGQLDVRRVVPSRAASRSAAIAAGVAVLLAALTFLAPNSLRRGLGLLVRTPTLYEGAAVSDEPLVSDVKLVYTYPTYTGLPPRTVDGATGDAQAIKGTRVDLEMHALRRPRRAILFFGEQGEAHQIEGTISGSTIRASFAINETARYRIWIAPLLGRPVRERRGHRVEAATDVPPVVEIKAAAERLELASPRPIEVGYAATDDFGLGNVNLVFRVGSAPEKRVALAAGGGKRQVQGSTMWDPSGESLVPGVQIAYWIEAKDTDTVSGAKTGVSRTMYVVLERPRETTDESLEQQKFVQERLLGVLADRLEANARGIGETPVNDEFTVWQSAHDEEAAQVALLAGLVDEQRRDGGASKSLLEALSKLADRLNKELKTEGVALRKAKPKSEEGRLTAGDLVPLRQLAPGHVKTLEDAVLVLDDLIGRQRLEDLAGLGEQLTQAYQKLTDLLTRYQNTKDEALREQLQREMQALRKRISDLAQKIAEVKSRNEVGSEWQNMPDTREAMAKAQKLEELLAKGDTDSLAKALAELGDSLQSLKQALNQNADEFTGEKFSKESRATAELTKKMSELEGDERQLAQDTRQLSEELRKSLQERQAKQIAEKLKQINEQMGALQESLKTPTPKRLGEDASDDQTRARDRASAARELLQRNDINEARKQMDELSGALSPLSKMAKQRARKDDASGSMARFAEKMTQAEELAHQIEEALEQMAPRDRDVATEAQRQQSQEQGARQQSIAERTRQLAQEAREGGSNPGFEQAAQGLEEAANQMGQAKQNLQSADISDALMKEQATADRLAQIREGLKSEKMARGSRNPDPVRIPGADDSKAPRAWRQELMEAMKEKSPENFRDAVRRYYEELVK